MGSNFQYLNWDKESGDFTRRDKVSEIIHGNCIEVLKRLDENSIDAIITDPPYELGFMGKSWDKSGIAFNTEVWSECLRVLKPGGHMLAFGGSRTFHRIAVAIEDAGFELRDTLMWVYGSGFPKSHDVSKGIDKKKGKERKVIRKNPNDREKRNNLMSDYGLHGGVGKGYITAPATPEAQMWEGWGTALKPAFEPIILARKPISEKNIAENVLKWGTGGINIDDCRVEYNGAVKTCSRKSDGIKDHTNPSGWKEVNRTPNRPATPTEAGRWPTNLIHDGSDEVLELFPETKSGFMKSGTHRKMSDNPNKNVYGKYGPDTTINDTYGDSGSAARFFYCAKASRKERGEGNNHPTVKPLALMQYLVRLVTPPDGIVLDPFAGSGSTLIAATREGLRYIGIELNEEYIEIAEKRLQAEQPLFEYNNT